MPLHNADIAAVFEEIADLLEIEDANPFRIRAYRNAARSVGEYGKELAEVLAAGGEVPHLPGIGADLAQKVREIATTGKCALQLKLESELPPAITELLRIPGLGPKRVRALWHELDIQTVAQLHRAACDGRIRTVPGFGVKTEANIRQALEAHLNTERRFKLAAAAPYAEALAAWLRAIPGVHRVTVAGSYRRMRETVGDLDIVVAAAPEAPVMARFRSYEEVAAVIGMGPTRASVRLRNGLQVDLRVVADASYGAALCYFTGSKPHNIALRRIAQDMGLKINEYGVFRDDRQIAGDTEESLYRAIGLPYIEPELRENRGEIEAARAGRLPRLVELRDLRGDLHVHTRASDGRDSLRAMAEAARARGLQYIAITEHSRRLALAHGLDARGLAAQCAEIDRLNAALADIVLLKSIEVDILEDGSLDLPDTILAQLDLVVGAVHSGFGLSRERQTERILRALDNPYFTILAHPTGRLLEKREPYDVDMPRIIHHARERGCHLELNAHPQRLDLIDTWCMAAREAGVRIAVSSDAHNVEDFDNLRYGIGQARRGWLEAGDVLNTLALPELRALLNVRR